MKSLWAVGLWAAEAVPAPAGMVGSIPSLLAPKNLQSDPGLCSLGIINTTHAQEVRVSHSYGYFIPGQKWRGNLIFQCAPWIYVVFAWALEPNPFLPRPSHHGQVAAACNEFGDQPYQLTHRTWMCLYCSSMYFTSQLFIVYLKESEDLGVTSCWLFSWKNERCAKQINVGYMKRAPILNSAFSSSVHISEFQPRRGRKGKEVSKFSLNLSMSS